MIWTMLLNVVAFSFCLCAALITDSFFLRLLNVTLVAINAALLGINLVRYGAI